MHHNFRLVSPRGGVRQEHCFFKMVLNVLIFKTYLEQIWNHDEIRESPSCRHRRFCYFL